MLSLWHSFVEWLRSLFFKREMELSLIGLNRAGKSTLVEVLASGNFKEDFVPTVGFNMRKITKGSVTIKLWDVAGQPRFQRLWERYCRGVQCIVYVVDAADHDSIEQTTKLLHDLMQRPNMQEVPLLVLGNKNDLPHALGTTELRDRMRLQEIRGVEVCVYSISCKNHNNIDLVLDWLIKHAKN